MAKQKINQRINVSPVFSHTTTKKWNMVLDSIVAISKYPRIFIVIKPGLPGFVNQAKDARTIAVVTENNHLY